MARIGEIIRVLRIKRGLSQTQLADAMGLKRSAIGNYELGLREPDIDTIEAFADFFDVSVSDLIGRDVYTPSSSKMPLNPSALRIPVLGSIPAGIPMEAIEDILDWEEAPASWANGGAEYFALRLSGDSMYPEYRKGDVVIFRRQDTCESGEDCAVMVNGCDATFKRVKLSDKGVALLPINPAYDPMFYTNSQVRSLPVQILGVFWELRRKRK